MWKQGLTGFKAAVEDGIKRSASGVRFGWLHTNKWSFEVA